MSHQPSSPEVIHAPDSLAVVFRLSSLGDVVLTTGVLEHWRRTRGLRFIFLTKADFAPLLSGHPAIERIIGIDQKRLRGSWLSVARELAQEHKDLLLIDLHGTLRSRTLSWLWSGRVVRYPKYSIERRLYMKWRRRSAEETLLSVNVPQRYALAMDSKAPLADELLPMIKLSNEELDAARFVLEERKIRTPLVVLHPYATHPSKTWRPEAWSTLAGSLWDMGWDWVVIGRDPSPFLREIDTTRDLTNCTSLRQTCALIENASALVSGDSGPIHLAGAVGTPVIALFGPTARVWGFYPQGPDDIILEKPMSCRPCSLHGKGRSNCREECLAGISPQEVIEALLNLRSARA